jgi:hypothetical protein
MSDLLQLWTDRLPVLPHAIQSAPQRLMPGGEVFVDFDVSPARIGEAVAAFRSWANVEGFLAASAIQGCSFRASRELDAGTSIVLVAEPLPVPDPSLRRLRVTLSLERWFGG